MDARLKDDARWFADHGSSRVGFAMADGLALARAEQALKESNAVVVWEPDDDADWSFLDDWSGPERERWDRTDHYAESARIVMPCRECIRNGWHSAETCRHSETLASLYGIIDADDSYRRVIAAELALECMPALRTPETA